MVIAAGLAPAATIATSRSHAVQVLNAVAVATGKGEARWWFGTLAEIQATAADTGGGLTLGEGTCPSGYHGARHGHHNEDQAILGLGGHLLLELRGENSAMNPRDYA